MQQTTWINDWTIFQGFASYFFMPFWHIKHLLQLSQLTAILYQIVFSYENTTQPFSKECKWIEMHDDMSEGLIDMTSDVSEKNLNLRKKNLSEHETNFEMFT